MSAESPNIAALYSRHKDAMHQVARSVLREAGRDHQAEDAVSDAVVSIMTAPPAGVRNWEAFLVTAAKRKALDRLKSAQVRHAGGSVDDVDYDQPDGTDVAEDVAEDLDRQARAAVARDSLVVLDDRHRTVVWRIAGLQHRRAEVAGDLGVSPARVSQMLTRGLALLRDEVRRKEGVMDERDRA